MMIEPTIKSFEVGEYYVHADPNSTYVFNVLDGGKVSMTVEGKKASIIHNAVVRTTGTIILHIEESAAKIKYSHE